MSIHFPTLGVLKNCVFYRSFHDWRLAGVSLGQFVNNAMDIDGFI